MQKFLRRTHPAWRLLAADSAPFVLSFLHHCFIRDNVRSLGEPELVARLDDYLHHLRERHSENAPMRAAADYLAEWADDAHGWLRRYYPADSDEPCIDLTPATEQALRWLSGLEQRTFVGAESRLKLVFDLLRGIAEGSDTDPDSRIAELERRRTAIEAEIRDARAGRLALMEPTQLRERFLQAVDTARALLSDFRQVEQNFRNLDRQAREKIATWEGGKGDVLEEVFGAHDAITDTDQGRSFRAFWDFLMSPARQQELTALLERILSLPEVAELNPDRRIRRVHYDWLSAGEMTQRTVARLSEQLRRYLDDQAWLENRRIMQIIRQVEQQALAVRHAPPERLLMSLDQPAPKVELPMDRPLFTPPVRPCIAGQALAEGGEDVMTDLLFEQFHVDKDRLRSRLRQALQTRGQISLGEILDAHPLEQGLAELVAWLSLATSEGCGVIDEDRPQTVTWTDGHGRARKATLPAVTFIREAGAGLHDLS
jgi:hypothetical protein